jgi:V-type H+-transporting ATPase subunit H
MVEELAMSTPTTTVSSETTTNTEALNKPPSTASFSAYQTHRNLLETLLPTSAVEEAFEHIHWSDVPYFLARTEFEQQDRHQQQQRLTLSEEQVALLAETQLHPMEYVLTNVDVTTYKSCMHKAQTLIQTCVQLIALTGQIVYCEGSGAEDSSSQAQHHHQSHSPNTGSSKQRRKIPSKKISNFTCGCQSRFARPFFRSRQSSSNISDASSGVEQDPMMSNTNASRHGGMGNNSIHGHGESNNGGVATSMSTTTLTSNYQSSHPMITEAQYAAAHEAELIMLIEADPLGVLVHWSVHTLYSVLVCLLEANGIGMAQQTGKKKGSTSAGGLKCTSSGEHVTLAGILLYRGAGGGESTSSTGTSSSNNSNTSMSCASMFIELMKALRACPKYDSYVSTTLGYVAAHMVLALSSTERGSASLQSCSTLLLDLDLHSFSGSSSAGGSEGGGVRVQQLGEELISWSCEKLSQSSSSSGSVGSGAVASNNNTSGTGTALDVVMPTLLTLLSEDKMCRQIFIAHGGIGYISKHLRRYTPGSSSSGSGSGTGIGLRRGGMGASSIRLKPPVERAMQMERSTDEHSTSININVSSNHGSGSDTGMKRRVNSTSAQSEDSMGPPSKAKNPATVDGRSEKVEASVAQSLSPSRLAIPALSDASYSAIVASTSATASSLTSVVTAMTPAFNANAAATSSSTSTTTTSSKTQQLYHLVFCLWALTLELLDRASLENSTILTRDRLVQRVASDGAIPALCGLVRSMPREKIVRVAMLCLNNLAAANDVQGNDVYHLRGAAGTSNSGGRALSHPHNDTIFVKEMLVCGLSLTLKNMAEGGSAADNKTANDTTNKATIGSSTASSNVTAAKPKAKKGGRIKDEQTRDNIQKLRKTLAEHESLTTTQWDVYVTELESGLLSWSSGLHTESFFRQNCRKMEGPNGDFYMVKLLLLHICGYANPSTGNSNSKAGGHASGTAAGENNGLLLGVDEEVLAVALFDVGEFVRHYPNGRLIAKQLGVTPFVMQLLDHESPDVQRHALQCISKLLVSSRHTLKAT